MRFTWSKWLCLFSPSNAQLILLVLFVEFVRWAIIDRTGAVGGCIASRLCLKQLIELLCTFQAFFLCVSLESNWCKHWIVLTCLQLGKNPILYNQQYQRRLTIDNLSILGHVHLMSISTELSADGILLSRYVYLSTSFRGLPLKVKIALSCWMSTLDLGELRHY